MTISKENLSGIAGTIGIHLLVFLLLFFLYITPKLDRSSEELGGVPVMFGNVPNAGGDAEPAGGTQQTAPNEEVVSKRQTTALQPEQTVQPTHTETPKVSQPSSNTEKVHSQDNEETVAAAAAAKKAAAERAKIEAANTERIRKEQAETQRIAQEKANKAAAIKNQTSGLFGRGSGSGSRGETSGNGTQGVPTGNSNHGKMAGNGGLGSYDLGGRSVGRGGLVYPKYSVDDYGKVVIDIIVDPKGNVVEASIGRGTNTPNASLRSEALRAAKRTKFTSANIIGNQKGTITYNFRLN